MYCLQALAVVSEQLVSILSQLSSQEYQQPIPVLEGVSIGRHTRHIISFFDVLEYARDTKVVDYDGRYRVEAYESDLNLAINKIKDLTAAPYLEEGEFNEPLGFRSDFDKLKLANTVELKTTFGRELIFNIEHAVHHMALIKIGLKATFLHIAVPESFGKAFSTITYENQHKAN